MATAVIRQQRLAQVHLDPQTAHWVQAPLDFAGRRLDEGGAEQQVAFDDRARQWAPLAFVYLLWIAVVLILHLPCRWFAEVKRRRRDAWLSYF